MKNSHTITTALMPLTHQEMKNITGGEIAAPRPDFGDELVRRIKVLASTWNKFLGK